MCLIADMYIPQIENEILVYTTGQRMTGITRILIEVTHKKTRGITILATTYDVAPIVSWHFYIGSMLLQSSQI